MSLDLLRKLWRSGRPHTGLYGLILSGYGFAYHGQTSVVMLVTMCTFALVTMSIMRYNDLVDATHDQQKGRWFATIHRRPLHIFWLTEALFIVGGLLWLMALSPTLCLFVGAVWIVGLLYSHIPHWFIVQNVVVALCSGSPALCAAVYQGVINRDDVHTFALFTSLIWLSEVHKDIEDANIDPGYKDTWATRRGAIGAMLLLVPSLHIVAAFFFWHPNWLLQIVALTLVPWMAYKQGLHLLGRVSITEPMRAMKHVIAACGIALFAPLILT